MDRSIYDIREDKVKIKGKAWDDPKLVTLSQRKIHQFQKAVSYWEYILLRSRQLVDRYCGRILTEDQRDSYEEIEDKVIVEPPIAKAPVRALVGQAIKGRRSGQITTEGGTYDSPAASAADVSTVNMVLKDMEIKTKEKYRMRDAIHDCFSSCYWNVLYYDLKGPTDGRDDGRLKLVHLPWDSCVFGPLTVREPDGSDFKEMFFWDYRSQADLEANFPDMVDQIRAHWEAGKETDNQMLSSLRAWEGEATSEDRTSLSDIVERSQNSMTGPTGLVPVVYHLFPIRRKEEVWVNMFDATGNDFEIRPPTWDDDKWDKWVQENSQKYFGPLEREVVTLWFTVFTTSGMILENSKHWFQENGQLPASFWVGAVIGGVPSGPMEDMSDDVLANCVAEIEYLDDLRKGSGTLALFKEGSIKNLEDIPSESNKSFGVGIVSKDFPGHPQEAFAELKRTPNDHWKHYAEQRKAGMYENTRLNESMQGAAAPRQAAIAKELEITQALIVNAIYLDNINRSWEYHQNLKLKIMPYVYDEYEVIDIFDEEENAQKQTEINVPEQFDIDGNVTSVINDLTSHRYKWKMNPVDDSPTAKIRQMEEATTVINAAAGPLIQADPTGKFFARFLQALPNQFLKDAGKAMAQDAQMQAEQQSKAQQQETLREAQVEMMKAQSDLIRAQKDGKNISISGADLAQYPVLFNLLQSWGMVDSGQSQVPMQQQQAAPQMQAQQQAAPPPQPPQGVMQ